MSSNNRLFLTTILFFLTCCSTFAQGGPPMITDDPVPVEKGHWEINNGIVVEHNATFDEIEIPFEDINYGLSNSIQLKYEVPLVLKHSYGSSFIGGPGRSNWGVKYRFINNSKHSISISVYPQFSFNTSSSSSKRGITDKGIELLLPFSFLKVFREHSILIELGRELESANQGDWIFGLLYDIKISESLDLAAEFFDDSDYKIIDNDIFFNVGSRIRFNRHFMLLLSAGNNFILRTKNDNTWIAYTGIQLSF